MYAYSYQKGVFYCPPLLSFNNDILPLNAKIPPVSGDFLEFAEIDKNMLFPKQAVTNPAIPETLDTAIHFSLDSSLKKRAEPSESGRQVPGGIQPVCPGGIPMPPDGGMRRNTRRAVWFLEKAPPWY